ncbi:hypothetical protein HYC85_013047, partial [Camellia sinensis]
LVTRLQLESSYSDPGVERSSRGLDARAGGCELRSSGDSSARARTCCVEMLGECIRRSSGSLDARAEVCECRSSGEFDARVGRLVYFYWVVAHPIWEYHFQEIFHIVIVCCIAAFGLGIGIEDVGAITFNMIDYGAVGNGVTNDTQAFMKAWEAVCKATGAPTLIVPAGKNFLLTPITFGGFCSSNTITVQVEGNIVAPSSLSQWPKFVGLSKWISFQFVNGLIINGGGQINGQGSIWWNAPVCNHNTYICTHSICFSNVQI